MGSDPFRALTGVGSRKGSEPFPLRRTWTAAALPAMLPFLSGAATVLAFAPVGFFPLALATFAILIALLADAAPRRAFWTGYAFGLGLFGAGVSWVYVSLHNFGGMPMSLAALATLLFCAFLALFPAAA